MTDTLDPLRAALPADTFRAVTDRYLEEPRGRYHGHALAVLAPRDVTQVATILRHANATRTPVVPYGGGTGLVGGQTAQSGPAPILLSLERMTAIRAVHPSENVLIAEAGATLSAIRTAAEQAARLFPLAIASQGTAQIGGNLATNAGGVNVLRYGNARDLCLGLEAVLPSGEIWHGLKRLRKDNTGYDLRNLLIGAEGTLGVITAAALRLFPRPTARSTAILTVPSPAAALDLLALAGDHLGPAISAFELMHRTGFDFLAETMPDLRSPFATPPEWCVLIDIGTSGTADPAAALEALFAAALEAGLTDDGTIAQSDTQAAALWALREMIPEGNRRIGAISSHDISVPLSEIPTFITRAGPALAKIDTFRINCFGHVGDGNLHYNVFPVAGRSRADHEHQRAAIKDCVHELVHALGGSVSAEHGIGRLKVDDLERFGDPTKLAAMRAIKSALDPNGIMNPGVILRAD